MTYEALKKEGTYLFGLTESSGSGQQVSDRSYWLIKNRVYMREAKFITSIDNADELRSALAGLDDGCQDELRAVERRLLDGEFTAAPQLPPEHVYGDSFIIHSPGVEFVLSLTGLDSLPDEAIWNRFAEAECRLRKGASPVPYDFGNTVRSGMNGCFQHITLTICDAYPGSVSDENRVHLTLSAGRRVKGRSGGLLRSDDDITAVGLEVAVTDIYGRKAMLFTRMTNKLRKKPH